MKYKYNVKCDVCNFYLNVKDNWELYDGLLSWHNNTEVYLKDGIIHLRKVKLNEI